MNKLQIFVDESGNTGISSAKKGKFNFGNQQIVGIGLVVNPSDKLIKKYERFKYRFNIEDEFKGNEIFTKANNDKLHYFLDNILNNENFYVCLTDKKDSLSSLFFSTIILPFASTHDLIDIVKDYKKYHKSIVNLCENDDEILIKFCEYLNDGSESEYYKFLNFLICRKYVNYEYSKLFRNLFRSIRNSFNYKTHKIVLDKAFNLFGTNTINFSNLEILIHSIIQIKDRYNCDNEDIEIIHDNILTYDKNIKESLNSHGLNNIEFKDSKDYIGLQLADNVASLIRKLFVNILKVINENKQYEKENRFLIDTFIKTINTIGYNNIFLIFSYKDIAKISALVDTLINHTYDYDVFLKIYQDYSSRKSKPTIYNPMDILDR